MSCRPWTKAEDDLIRELAPELSPDDLASHFPNRTRAAVCSRRTILGIKVSRKDLWSDEEIERLKSLSPNLNVNELLEHFPGRTKKAIKTKKRDLNLTYKPHRPWTKEEDKIIMDMGYDHTPKEILEFLPHRSEYSIGWRRRFIGVEGSPGCGDTWSTEDLKLFKSKARNSTNLELKEMFPDRTLDSLTQMRFKLGLNMDEETLLRAKEQSVEGGKRKKLDQNFTLNDLDNVEYQVLMGSILGDAGIHYTYSGAILTEHHTQKQADYVRWKSSMLKSFSSNYNEARVTMITPSHKIFEEIRDYSYRLAGDGKFRKFKLKSAWISRLDLLGLLVWYLDDGSFCISTQSMSIAVFCFENHIQEFIDHFDKNYGIELTHRPSTGLGIPIKTIKKLTPIWQKMYYDYEFPECMKYKFAFDVDYSNRGIKNYKKWEDDEIEILKENYLEYSDQELVDNFFPYRSKQSVALARRNILGCKRKTRCMWTDEDLDFLEKNAGKLSDQEIAEKLDGVRSAHAVRHKRLSMGITIRW